jgi:hypothetical protein
MIKIAGGSQGMNLRKFLVTGLGVLMLLAFIAITPNVFSRISTSLKEPRPTATGQVVLDLPSVPGQVARAESRRVYSVLGPVSVYQYKGEVILIVPKNHAGIVIEEPKILHK